MATIHTQGFHEEHARHVSVGPAVDAAVGLAGVVLAILGLVGVAPQYMAPIATIAVGAALAFEGAALQAGTAVVSAEFTAGMAGIVLGILAILGVEPVILTSVAVLIFSGGLLLTAGSSAHFGAEGTLAVSGSHVLSGVAGIVLGIIALVGTVPMTLNLVALLVIGATVSFGGGVWSSRLVRMFRR